MSDPTDQFDHRSHPPATALGPDDDEAGEITDTDEEAVDAVEQLLAPGQSPDEAGSTPS